MPGLGLTPSGPAFQQASYPTTATARLEWQSDRQRKILAQTASGVQICRTPD